MYGFTRSLETSDKPNFFEFCFVLVNLDGPIIDFTKFKQHFEKVNKIKLKMQTMERHKHAPLTYAGHFHHP